ncbi:MAG: hypothetical protein AB1374_00680 [Bacillota bacterium]
MSETAFAELYRQTEEVKKTIYGFMRYLRSNPKRRTSNAEP